MPTYLLTRCASVTGTYSLGGGCAGSLGAYSITRHSWPAWAFAPSPFGWLGAGAQRQDLQPDIPPNPVLQVNDIVALLQLGEINVQGRTRRLRVRRLEAARPLHLVTPEDLGVGDDDQPGLVAEEAAGQSAEVSAKSEGRSPKAESRSLRLRFARIELWSLRVRSFLHQPVFLPNLGEALPLAVVVAEDVDRVALAQPAVQLGEELAPLRLGHLRLRGALRQRTESLQALEVRSAECGVRNAARPRGIQSLRERETALHSTCLAPRVPLPEAG